MILKERRRKMFVKEQARGQASKGIYKSIMRTDE